MDYVLIVVQTREQADEINVNYTDDDGRWTDIVLRSNCARDAVMIGVQRNDVFYESIYRAD